MKASIGISRLLTSAALLGVVATGVTRPAHASALPPPTPATMAGLGSLDHGGVFAPVIAPMSQDQLVAHARRLDAYKAAVAQHAAQTNAVPNGDPGGFGGLSGAVNVTAYAEPNSVPYRNYCGPGASQVLISNWTSNVPSIDTLASQEQTDPNGKTLFGNMVGPLNTAVNSTFYGEVSASSQGVFNGYIGADIYNSHRPLMTAIHTIGNGQTLNGWTVAADHILTIFGFDFRVAGAGTISYVETAGSVAGTTSTGYNSFGADPFWTLVLLNNGQIW